MVEPKHFIFAHIRSFRLLASSCRAHHATHSPLDWARNGLIQSSLEQLSHEKQVVVALQTAVSYLQSTCNLSKDLPKFSTCATGPQKECPDLPLPQPFPQLVCRSTAPPCAGTMWRSQQPNTPQATDFAQANRGSLATPAVRAQNHGALRPTVLFARRSRPPSVRGREEFLEFVLTDVQYQASFCERRRDDRVE